MIRKTQQLFNNMKVSYLEAGEGAPLVLIHGVGMNAECWYPQLEAFSRDYRVIAVDMPGHGQSDGFRQAATLEDYVHWLADFLATQPEADFAVAGHSMGALITAGFAIEYPERTNHAVVISGVFQRSPQASQAVLDRAEQLSRGQAQLDSPLTRWFSATPGEQRLREQVGDWLQQVDLQGYARAYQAFAAGDRVYASRWSSLRCPVLVITGEFDANSSPEMARQMALAAPNGRAVIIDNAKHMVSLTDAQRVNAEILGFLSPTAQRKTSQNDIEGVINGRG
ncbi:alpha/beta fold hydrolase [Serratia odorifera]|uniref:alpha/beta fold hydrolase n=1 Tax=Serratia odorifera TaxID=618 RepID=UPI002362CE75|nr:alpha/beta hydrolase [Serratia odorifera]